MANDDLVTITMNDITDDYHIFITRLNAREKPPCFDELTRILLQEEERRLSLKPQDSDLALITKFKTKGREMADQRRGNTSKRTPQGVTSHKHDSAPKFFFVVRYAILLNFSIRKRQIKRGTSREDMQVIWLMQMQIRIWMLDCLWLRLTLL